MKGINIYFVFTGEVNEKGTEKYLLKSLEIFVRYLELNFISSKTFKALNPNDLKDKQINVIDITKKNNL